MSRPTLTVTTLARAETPPGEESLSLEQLRDLLYSGRVLTRLWRYGDVQLLVDRVDNVPRPSITATVLRLLGRGRCRFTGGDGTSEGITYASILPRLAGLAADALAAPAVIRRVRGDVARRLGRARARPRPPGRVDWHAPSVYVYALPDVGMRAGGSVGHIAGVLNNLGAFTGPPVFLTTAAIPTVRPDIERHFAPPPARFRDFPAVRMVQACQIIPGWAETTLRGRPVAFIYQRYTLYDYSGVVLAGRRAVPLVIEYNGSEVWVGRNWGQKLAYEDLAARIELLNLHAADVVVVVSTPLRDELVTRGIDPAKILVNPNGIDPDRYSPEVRGEGVRKQHGLDGKTVVGFIGTFGPWHGAEVLAEAFGRVLAARPEYRERVRLLMIGDGTKMGDVRAALDRHGAAGFAVLTGLVPQADGPKHLAACDVLASPHVPNPDGTPFFGSPTKLFEYMGMGKGIVASDLDQIGEVLAHDRTAWMVRPGDPDDLARGLQALIDDPDRRRRLGAAARAEVVANYTWRTHTRRIVEFLGARCPERRKDDAP